MMKAEDIQHFLVTYYTRESRVDVQEFGNDHDAALEAYMELEYKYRDREDLDIVLLGADSLETVKRTHSSYFGEGKSAFAHLLADLESVTTIAGGADRPIRTPRRRRGAGRGHR
jgi:hypothetical protein